jgi:lipid II:glycine glycyltransferase (peptidoglycan interpeptide bridge formation enzyme)
MDSLSAFLHTPEWEQFQSKAGFVVHREHGALYIERALARRSYWQTSRIEIGEEWAAPAFTRNAWFLRIEPDSAESFKNLEKTGHLVKTAAHQPSQTSVVDLRRTEEEILASFKQKHRYNVRLAEKHGIRTDFYGLNAANHFERFWSLLSQTSERQDFRTHSKEYYRLMLEHLAPSGMVELGFATFEDTDLSTVLLIHCGSCTTYLHGASSNLHKELMAPFALHWAAMRSAKQKGSTQYDLWGTHAIRVGDEWKPIDGHASAGTTRFKLGWSGEIVEYPGTYDLVFRALPYRLYASLRGIRSRKRAFA